MTKENWLYSVIGLLLGIVIASLYLNVSAWGHYRGMGGMMGGDYRVKDYVSDNNSYSDRNMHSAMSGMMSGLSGKTGDEFDKAFLSEMIEHHEGAVDMAEAALKNAKHQEIKDLAKAIIEAQTKEINQMKDWQKSWYPNN